MIFGKLIGGLLGLVTLGPIGAILGLLAGHAFDRGLGKSLVFTSPENVARIQEAGADYALSISQVTGQLLAYHVIGKMVSQQARIKLVKLDAGRIAGLNPLTSGIRTQTGCTIVAVERADDALYMCGTPAAFERFYEAYPDSSGEQASSVGEPLPETGVA